MQKAFPCYALPISVCVSLSWATPDAGVPSGPSPPVSYSVSSHPSRYPVTTGPGPAPCDDQDLTVEDSATGKVYFDMSPAMAVPSLPPYWQGYPGYQDYMQGK